MLQLWHRYHAFFFEKPAVLLRVLSFQKGLDGERDIAGVPFHSCVLPTVQ